MWEGREVRGERPILSNEHRLEKDMGGGKRGGGGEGGGGGGRQGACIYL